MHCISVGNKITTTTTSYPIGWAHTHIRLSIKSVQVGSGHFDPNGHLDLNVIWRPNRKHLKLFHANIRENSKAPHYWSFVKEPRVTSGFQSQRASNTESVSISCIIILTPQGTHSPFLYKMKSLTFYLHSLFLFDSTLINTSDLCYLCNHMFCKGIKITSIWSIYDSAGEYNSLKSNL